MKPAALTSRIAASIIALTAFLVFGYTLVRAVAKPEFEQEIPIDSAPQAAIVRTASSTVPERLIIPAIGVDAKVQDVGISKRGTMAVPTSYDTVGWYRYGPVPGATGSAVMDGHLDNGFGLPAVFKRLEDLHKGDEVYVVGKDGRELRFVVVRTSFYDYDASTDEMFSNDGAARLNLITCEGTWNPEANMYSNRRIIFTELAAHER